MKKKTLFTAMLMILCLFIFPMIVKADYQKFKYGGTKETVVGGTVNYSFYMPLDSCDMEIKYDSTVLEYVKPTTTIYGYAETVQDGIITRSYRGSLLEGSEELKLSFAEFKVKSLPLNGVTEIEVKLSNQKLYIDGQLQDFAILTVEKADPIKITQITNNNPVEDNTDEEKDNQTDDKESEEGKDSSKAETDEMDTRDIMLYSSIGLNLVLAVTTLIISIKKSKVALS